MLPFSLSGAGGRSSSAEYTSRAADGGDVLQLLAAAAMAIAAAAAGKCLNGEPTGAPPAN